MISIKELIGTGLHIGRNRRNWTSVSERYLSGYRHSVSVFDLSQTSFHLKRASNFITAAVGRYGRGFFYGLTLNDKRAVTLLANLGQVVSYYRWNGGFLTNIKKFKTKIKNVKKVPSFVVCLKFEMRNYSALREKSRLKLPLICPIDSDSDPAYAEYPIPGNASARSTVNYFNYCFSRAVFSGISKRIKRIAFVKKIKQKTSRLRGKYQGAANFKISSNFNPNYGRKRNRTAAVSFSGLYSTIELSPVM